MIPVGRIAADERGMTLVELMVSLAIGGMVLAAALTMFLSGSTGAAQVQDREDAAQRARIGLDRVMALVGAQVCNGVTSAGAPVVVAEKNRVWFTANMAGVDDDPIGYELRYDSAAKTLTEYRYPLVGSENVAGYKAWAASPSSSSELLHQVVAATGKNVFTYYGTDDADTGAPLQFQPGGGALTAAERPRVLRIDVNLRVLPTRTGKDDDKRSTQMETQNYVSSSVQTQSLDQGPKC